MPTRYVGNMAIVTPDDDPERELREECETPFDLASQQAKRAWMRELERQRYHDPPPGITVTTLDLDDLPRCRSH